MNRGSSGTMDGGTKSTLSSKCRLPITQSIVCRDCEFVQQIQNTLVQFFDGFEKVICKNMGYSCGVNSQKKTTILPIDWIQPQCYQKHSARIGVSRALFKPV